MAQQVEGMLHTTGRASDYKSLLSEWQLSEFEKIFNENGFTDPIDWIHIDESDMNEMGFKKGHKLRFQRKLKEFVANQNFAESKTETDDMNNPKSSGPELLGGDGWIELGEFRLGQVDNAHFSFCHVKNRKTCVIFRSDGTIHPGL